MKLLEDVKNALPYGSKQKMRDILIVTGRTDMEFFSVSPLDIDRVAACIRHQKPHHKNMSFKQEFRKFLKTYDVDYDERYVWD